MKLTEISNQYTSYKFKVTKEMSDLESKVEQGKSVQVEELSR